MREQTGFQINLFDRTDAKAAVFSPCRKFRYTLWRHWGNNQSFVQFIGLNPSTADEFVNDPTLRRCINFAKDWGYDGMCMTNLFAYRATEPSIMKAAPAPVGIENDDWLLQIAKKANLIIAAWGNHGTHLKRAAEVLKFLPQTVYCLGQSKQGFPLHPLYQPKSCQPVRFTSNQFLQ